MRTAYFITIAAFLFLAEESIISDFNRYGKVDSIHIDKSLISDMSKAFENIQVDSLGENGIETTVNALEKISSVAINPIVGYSENIKDLSKELSQVNKK